MRQAFPEVRNRKGTESGLDYCGDDGDVESTLSMVMLKMLMMMMMMMMRVLCLMAAIAECQQRMFTPR